MNNLPLYLCLLSVLCCIIAFYYEKQSYSYKMKNRDLLKLLNLHKQHSQLPYVLEEVKHNIEINNGTSTKKAKKTKNFGAKALHGKYKVTSRTKKTKAKASKVTG